jgi:hypothetical protein
MAYERVSQEPRMQRRRRRTTIADGAFKPRASYSYRESNFLPAFKLSKFKIVLNTSGYVPIVSPR